MNYTCNNRLHKVLRYNLTCRLILENYVRILEDCLYCKEENIVDEKHGTRLLPSQMVVCVTLCRFDLPHFQYH